MENNQNTPQTPAASATEPPAAPATTPAPAAAGQEPTGTVLGGEQGGQAAEGTVLGGAQAKANDATPTDIEVTLPEGMEVDEALFAALKGSVKDSASGQKLLNEYAAANKRAQDKAKEAWGKQQQDWVKAIKADPEVGGEKFAANLAHAETALKLAPPGFRKWLDETGLGSYPDMVKFVMAVGKALGEDSLAGTSGQATRTTASRAMHEVLYPTMQQEG